MEYSAPSEALENFEAFYRSISRYLSKRTDFSGLNSKEDINSLRRIGVWKAIVSYDSEKTVMSLGRWCVWKTNKYVLDCIYWKKFRDKKYIACVSQSVAAEAEGIEWPPAIPVDSDEDTILWLLSAEKMINCHGNFQQKYIWSLLTEDEGWSHREMADVISVCPSRVSVIVQEIVKIIRK